MSSQTALIFDVDNTIYNFVDFFGPSFRAMVHILSKSENISESDIIRSAKDVYQRAGTLDHQFLIENMDVFEYLPRTDHDRLIRLARIGYSRANGRRLRLYDGIDDLLRSARAAGIKCICLTNAPYYLVEKRLKKLGVLSLLNGLVAWEGSLMDMPRPEYVKKYSECRERLKRTLELFETVDRSQIKPSAYSFSIIQKQYGFDHEYYSIGDSISKDLLPAQSCGMRAIWAKYGAQVDPVNLSTLLEITPWTSDEVSPPQVSHGEPDDVAESPLDLIKILRIPEVRRPTQGDLFSG